MKIKSSTLHGTSRLDAVEKYHILDSEDEENYNDIVEIASQVCQTPIAVVTFLDDKRQWFKARKGLEIRETDIHIAFCAHAVDAADIFIVTDAWNDPMFRDNPLVTSDPHIRFYAGVPLKMKDGKCIGTVAVMDQKTRILSTDQLKGLKILSRQVVELLNARLENFEMKKDVIDNSNQVTEVLDRISDAFIAVDTEWIITFINEKASHITGRSRESVIGKNLWNEFPNALSSLKFTQMSQDALAQQRPQIAEEFFERYNVWLETKIFPSQTGLSIFFKDITERKRTEEALRESESNYKKLIEGNPQPMWIYEIATLMILEVNEAAIVRYGYTREEFLNMTINDLRPESERIKLKNFMEKNISPRSGYTHSGPWKHHLKDGTLIDVEITSHEIIWQGRRSRFTLAWDVTRRLMMENSLRRAEEQYRSIFENASEAIYQTTPDGKFITANPAMAKMLGYASPEELMSMVTRIGEQLYADGNRREQLKELLIEEGTVDGVEMRMVRKDGAVIWVRANARAIRDASDNVLYFEGTMIDITHRREAEEKLRSQYEQLQKTNDELDRFVYSVSHDIRAPLATILGLIHVAELESPSKVFAEYLKMIRTNVKRLDGFINDILDYSLNARKELQIEEIDFQILLEGLIKTFNFLPSADRLKVNLEVHSLVPFYSDRYRLTIVLNNLLTNAVKYQDFNKPNSYLSIYVVTAEQNALVRISDNGIGIAQRHLDKVFNMFYRASENSKGSGLGLYIAKETTAKLGGIITVQSEFGVYTSFEVNIPNLKNQ